jgi:hypothetical protein
MRQWFTICGMFLSIFSSFGQSKDLSEGGCATITTPQEMQAVADYLAYRVKAKTTTANDTIPLSIHIVGKDDGTGYYKLDHLLTVLCQLNTRYAPVGFYFYMQGPIQYINNTAYYIHDYWNGYNMMTSNNVANTVNLYFVEDPNGACGYYSPAADAIAIGKSCSMPNSTTVTHELGHFFGLPHTFYGWEGGPPANPEKVTRTAGANCSSTGDLFCDTDADYLAARWNCPYTGVKTDVNGDYYHPDSSLYMGYATDACMSRFSNQQIGRLQDNLHNQRSNLLSGSHPTYTTLDTPKVVYPTDSLYANAKTIKWNKVPGATSYWVKITLGASTILRQEALTTDTTLLMNFNLVAGYAYRMTVLPLSPMNLCREKPLVKDFTYSTSTPALSVSGVTKIDGNISLYPNPASRQVTINLHSVPQGKYTVQLSNVTGQRVQGQTVQHNGADQKVNISLQNLPTGMYILKIAGDNAIWTEKLMIQN